VSPKKARMVRQMQTQLPFKAVKQRRPTTCKCSGVQKTSVGVQSGTEPITFNDLRVPYAYAQRLEDRVKTQEAELNRLRWYEFQYFHLTQSKVLVDQRLCKVLHDFIEFQVQSGEYSGIFY